MKIDTRSAAELLALDASRESERIADAIRAQVLRTLKRKGLVLGLSGGIDSSVAAALCVRALGADRVLGLMMPEADSSSESTTLGRLVGDHLRIRTIVEDITSTLEGTACYRRRDDAIRTLVPEYGAGYKSKIVMSPALDSDRYRVFLLVVESPDGEQRQVRLTADTYLTIVAATNFKQRVRKMMEYYYADRYQYAVVGTPNLLEYDQGFFVKNGDGAADVKPIAHLYKTQIYQLAEFLDIPEVIRKRRPTTDTFSLAQSQEEFYFSVPYEVLDVCLYGLNNGMSADSVAPYAGLTADQVTRVYHDIESKRRATGYLHRPALTLSAPPPQTS